MDRETVVNPYNGMLFLFVFCSVAELYLSLCDPVDCSTPGLPVPHQVCPSSCPLHQWCHPTISSSFTLSSFCLQCFSALGGQSIGASASASVLPMSIQSWFPLGLMGLISLEFKGQSRVFSSTTVQKHQFFSTLPSLWSSSLNHTWLLKRS